tara:strand:- start:1172 stop:1621 length:450 start_codon:yes stop_codon:yes gene_type:complete
MTVNRVIFDVDGTLFNIDQRRHLVEGDNNDWKTFLSVEAMEGDTPNQPVLDVCIALQDAGSEIVVVSARNERHRQITETQLHAAGVQFSHLFLREDVDYRPDSEFKRDVLHALRDAGWNPDLVFDDRNAVVEVWREEGVPCFQVADGDF